MIDLRTPPFTEHKQQKQYFFFFCIYPIIKLEFTGVGESKGTFETNLFIPTSEKDMERRTVTNANGHESKRPSSFENFQYTLMQIVEVLNPKGAEKIKENGDKIKTIDQFIDLIFKALKGKENVTTNLKLVGRNNQGKIFAALPNACGLSKKDEIFATNFIGENLFFSNYEETQLLLLCLIILLTKIQTRVMM